MSDNLDYSKSITIPSNLFYSIWSWYEDYRIPHDPIKPVTITVSHTGIGQVVKAQIELKPGQGVYKDFSEYDKW